MMNNNNNMHKLMDIVYDIYHSTTDFEERRKLYKEKYPEFVNNYSHIFEMLCKPRFNFDKFIEITYNLSNGKSKKRKRCSEEADEEKSYLTPDILIPKLKDMFHQQEIAVEYIV